ncbi:MAG: tRNA (adenosine(37)-N6)-dimethylallyltransferase [Candidatus Dormibacteria bacterium]
MGPTASGKTALAVQLALAFGGELVNADSRQAIAGVRVGVCKPTPAELLGVRCHGLDWRQIGEPYSAAEFAVRARKVLDEIWSRGKLPIVVGGTGLYVRGLLGGFDFGELPSSPATRSGSPEVLARLAPERAAGVDLRNPRRVARAVELARAGRQPGAQTPQWAAMRLAIQIERGELRTRIEARAQGLVGEPLAEEITRLRAQGVADEVISGVAIGYREGLAWVDGHLSGVQAARAISGRTWRYARSQLTWLRSEPDLTWVRSTKDAKQLVSLLLPRDRVAAQ